MTLRLFLSVTFLGIGLLWVAFFGWVAWRLGPGGYSANDAQEDRQRMCDLIETLHPNHGHLCPKILESD